MKTSLWFYPNQQKKSAKTGKVPLYVRVILNGKKSEGRLYHAELSPKESLQWNEQAMRHSDPKHKANKLINAVQRDFDEFIILNSKNINRYSASSRAKDRMIAQVLYSCPFRHQVQNQAITPSMYRSFSSAEDDVINSVCT